MQYWTWEMIYKITQCLIIFQLMACISLILSIDMVEILLKYSPNYEMYLFIRYSLRNICKKLNDITQIIAHSRMIRVYYNSNKHNQSQSQEKSLNDNSFTTKILNMAKLNLIGFRYEWKS